MSIETRITEAASTAVSRLDEEFRARIAALNDEIRTAATAASAAVAAAQDELGADATLDALVRLALKKAAK